MDDTWLLTGSAAVSVLTFGFALANELKRLLFSRLGGAGFPVGLDD